VNTISDPEPRDIRQADINRCLAKLLATKPFLVSEQMSAFVTYVVSETLAGRADTIKSYTVAVDGLGKPDTFDPQSDPSVRVLAGRVRQALSHYYSAAGKADDLRIIIKPGSYIPQFMKQPVKAHDAAQSVPNPAPPPPGNQQQTAGRRWHELSGTRARRPVLAAIAVAALALVILGAGYFSLSAPFSRAPVQKEAENLEALPRISVQVMGTGHEPDWYSPTELASALAVVLSRFDNLELTKVKELTGSPDLVDGSGDYHILINSEPRGDAIRFFARLIRTRDQTAIWSREALLSRPVNMEERNVTDLVGSEVAPVLSPNGVLFADLGRQTELPENVACLIKGYRYFAARSAEGHGPALACANQLVDAGSKSPPMIAMLTFLVLDIYRYGYSKLDKPLLPTAHHYALKALDLAPGSARAHQALFAYYKVSGDHANAEVTGKRAVALNPYDIDILGDYGSYLVSQGNFDNAMPIMLTVEKLALTTPEWFNVHLYLGAHFSGNDQAASRAAGRLKNRDSPMAHLVRAMAQSSTGDQASARMAIKALVTAEQGFAMTPTDRLLKRGFAPSVARNIVRELVGAGLQVPTN